MRGGRGRSAGSGTAVPVLLASALLFGGCGGERDRPPLSTIAGNDSVVVFDHHVHVLSPALVERWTSEGVPFSKPPGAYSNIDTILQFDPSDGMFLVSMAYLWSTVDFSDSAERSNVERENDFVAGLAKRHPGRLFAFCAVDPLRPWAVEELRRCRREAGAYGLKLHLPTSGVDLADPRHVAMVREVLAAASAEGMPVILHYDVGPDRPAAAAAVLLIDSLLAPAPPLELFLAHLGTSGGYTQDTRAIVRAFIDARGSGPALRKHRLWFDISGVALTSQSGQVPPLSAIDFTELAGDLREIGLDRVVFGTDYPAFNTVACLSTLEAELPLTRRELIGIAGNGLPAGFSVPEAR